MSKLIHIFIILGFVQIILNIISNYFLNYFNFLLYHLSFGIHLFFSKFLAQSTLSIVSLSIIGSFYIFLTYFFINLIKD